MRNFILAIEVAIFAAASSFVIMNNLVGGAA